MKLATAFLAANQMIENNLEYVPIEVSDQTQELRVPEKHIGAIMGEFYCLNVPDLKVRRYPSF